MTHVTQTTDAGSPQRSGPGDRLPEIDSWARAFAKSMPADDAVEALTNRGVGVPEAKAAVARALEDPEVRDVLAKRKRETFDPQPLDLAAKLDRETPKPDWLVQGVLERRTVTMLSGDTGAAKSLLWLSLAAALAKGEPWLGHEVKAKRILVIEEENPEGLTLARMRALGLRGKHASALRVHSREGWMLGNAEHDERLHEEISEFEPDLIVLDTLMSTTAVDVNDNVAAVKTMKHFRSIVEEHDCGILVLHHERKLQRDGPSAGSSQQSMGARQWMGQADEMLTTAVESEMKREDLDDGHYKLRRTFKVRLGEKGRDGRVNPIRRVAVESEKDVWDRLLWLTVTDEGPVREITATDEHARSILTALIGADDWLQRKAIAQATGEALPAQPSGTWKTALAGLVDDAFIEHKGQRYRATEAGAEHLTEIGMAL